jgi:hypothetical protein
MSVIVPNRLSVLKLTVQPPLPLATLDLSCYTTAWELAPETEDIDVGTFCAPALSDVGRTTFTATVSLLWEPALYTLLQPYIGAICTFSYEPDSTLVPKKYVRFTCRYGSQPWGRFELGQRVEVELPLAVLTTPDFYEPISAAEDELAA